MKRRGLSLVDVLAAALERPDAACGPPVVALTWAGPDWVVLQTADVQQSVQCESAPVGEVPVILGTSQGVA